MRAGRRERWFAMAAGGVGGIVAAIPAIVLAIASGGAGHGDYGAARALFPVPMLLGIPGGRLGPASVAVGLVQFPIYGAIVGRAMTRRSYRLLVAVALVQAGATIACFAGAAAGFD